jgi:hypothetical protein
MKRRTPITEAEYEALVDHLVQKRLSTDSDYRNAEDANSQSEREAEVTAEVEWDLIAKFDPR